MMKTVRMILALLILSLLAACAPPTPDAARESTVAALAKRVEQTSTAAAAGESEPKAAQANAELKATQVVEDLAATQTAQVQLDAEAIKATREVERPVLAELSQFDLDPEKGRVAWVHPPLTLVAEGSKAFEAGNNFPEVIVEDFAITADITWDTRGDSGCGFVIRSNGDRDKPSQYMFGITRFANGHAVFMVTVDGELVNAHDFYPKRFDRQFDAQNQKTNRLTVVGRGFDFKIYTNGVLIGETNPNEPPKMQKLPDPPQAPVDQNNAAQQNTFTTAQAEYQQQVNDIQALFRERVKLFRESDKELERGFVTFAVFTDTGRSSCIFDNAWLWLIEE